MAGPGLRLGDQLADPLVGFRMQSPPGRVVQVNVSPGGVPKRPVPEGRVTALGIAGDQVAHPRIHGGPERALCLFFQEVISRLQAEGHPIQPGSVGENLTLAGIDYPRLRTGDVLSIGQTVRLRLTRPTTPCKTIAGAFRDGDVRRIHESRGGGAHRWYAAVLAEGLVRPGDPVQVEARPA